MLVEQGLMSKGAGDGAEQQAPEFVHVAFLTIRRRERLNMWEIVAPPLFKCLQEVCLRLSHTRVGLDEFGQVTAMVDLGVKSA
jgi:hypothetical protein